MRLAVIGTPRSGNSLLRRVLSHAYGLREAASHDPDVLLGELPDHTVFQVHARYTPAAAASLREQQVIVVTPQRHPLDTLLSMLHFAQFEPEVDRWLGGGYLTDLEGCDPTSRAFREFALGDGAADLLGVTVDWCRKAHLTVPFAELADDPLSVLANEGLGPHRIVGGETQVRQAASFDGFRRTANMHGWMGRPDYWPAFIDRDFATEIRERHSDAFTAGSFDIEEARDHLAARDVRVTWAHAFAPLTALEGPTEQRGSSAGWWSRVRTRAAVAPAR